MKKFLLSISVAVLFVAYVIIAKRQQTPAAASIPNLSSQSADTSAPSSTETVVSNSPPSSTTTSNTAPKKTTTPTVPAPKPTGQFKDGSFTGSVVDAFYGNVQVQAVISGGKLTEVKFLQYPSDRQESQQISSMSLPQLRSEAISAQSANVDVVSGATQTSEAFMQSLASALAKAKS
jgi:uncharacterized protein with FMN-binding domain